MGDFSVIDLGTFKRNECSPAIDEPVEALRIDTPSTVVLRPGANFPLCGSFRAAAPLVNSHMAIGQEIVIVAVDAANHHPRAANLALGDGIPAPMAFDETLKGWRQRAAKGWFNVDLFDLVGVPRKPGRYHVFATVSYLTSNVCTVSVVEP